MFDEYMKYVFLVQENTLCYFLQRVIFFSILLRVFHPPLKRSNTYTHTDS